MSVRAKGMEAMRCAAAAARLKGRLDGVDANSPASPAPSNPDPQLALHPHTTPTHPPTLLCPAAPSSAATTLTSTQGLWMKQRWTSPSTVQPRASAGSRWLRRSGSGWRQRRG